MTRLGWLLLAGFAFGLLVAEVKGQSAGVRDAVGNTSAPWVVVPFLAGTRYSQVGRAALIGLATTLAGFFGFYLAEAWILDLGPHPWYVDLQLTLGSGHVFEVWGGRQRCGLRRARRHLGGTIAGRGADRRRPCLRR